ncbi:hypothetical protein BC940DRAFT_290492 [Gongronella butleri]|nr:hypothetical protein BC940DRAFT_290492 [Gongronella butleri]
MVTTSIHYPSILDNQMTYAQDDAYKELALHAEYLQKQLGVLQRENKQLLGTQQNLETQIEAQEDALAASQKEVAMLKRKSQGLETRLDTESHRYDADRSMWLETESHLTQRIKVGTTQTRRARRATVSAVQQGSDTALTAFCNRCEGQRIKMDLELAKTQAQHERLVAHLEKELVARQAEHDRGMQKHMDHLASVQAELAEIKRLHVTLMEENELHRLASWPTQQTLVEPKQMTLSTGPPSLASEISQLSDDNTLLQDLQQENQCLKEANKALSSYMNKILSKIVGDHSLVDILNVDDDQLTPKPSPVPPVADQRRERPRRSTISHCTSAEKGWTRAFKRVSMLSWAASNKPLANA